MFYLFITIIRHVMRDGGCYQIINNFDSQCRLNLKKKKKENPM